MKKIAILAALSVLLVQTATPQNVGIGESDPGAKLTVKGEGFASSLLVKNSNNDSLIYTNFRNIRLGGYHSSASGVVSISNKNFLPLDPPQLELVAAGERDAGNVNGSMSFLRFANVNSNKHFSLDSYVGGDINLHSWKLSYFDPEAVDVFKTILYITPNGQAGLSTFAPTGKLQINHRGSPTNPTLNLFDSSGTQAPVIQLRNNNTDYWQIRGQILNTTPANNFLDFATMAGIRMTLRGDGNLGIGDTNPAERLQVTGNVRVTGDVQRASTGAANLVPICYGSVSQLGTITHGTGNFTVNHILDGLYEITITGENFLFSIYTTVVTPASATPVVTNMSSGGGNLLVRIVNLSGVATNAGFNFVVYKQ